MSKSQGSAGTMCQLQVSWWQLAAILFAASESLSCQLVFILGGEDLGREIGSTLSSAANSSTFVGGIGSSLSGSDSPKIPGLPAVKVQFLRMHCSQSWRSGGTTVSLLFFGINKENAASLNKYSRVQN